MVVSRLQSSSRYQRTTIHSLSLVNPANGRKTTSIESLDAHCFWEAVSW
uniref:Uncharacterized protein n=1 Tax=Arundo donax TaxID=35708 RepID=A0A0A9FS53_ARUDO